MRQNEQDTRLANCGGGSAGGGYVIKGCFTHSVTKDCPTNCPSKNL